jgi:arylsulfatase A-like enzyme
MLTASLAILLATVAQASVGPIQTEARRPNVLFLLVDDLGFMDVSANNPDCFYQTPNIQRLADEGMRFTDGYAACPVCSPTRASIFTGKYPVRVGITDYISPGRGNQPENWKRKTTLLPAPYQDRMLHQEFTLAEAFQQAGYATFFAGKWHLGPEGFWPEDQGFDVNRGGITRGGPYGGNKYFSPYGNPRLTDGPEGEHLPQRLADETVAFMQAHAEQPFLAFLSFYSVHTPLMARPDLKQKYAQLRSDGPAEAWGVEGQRKVRMVQNHAVYASMVEAMDQAVGTVLNGLDELGLAEHTIVVFFSDNGGLSTSEGSPTSNLPYRAGKGWLYEGGIREPLIMRVPGLTKPGSVSTVPVTSTDFYPTLLELAGLDARPQQHLDGVSLLPLLHGAENLAPRSLYWHYPHYGNQGGQPGAAMRSGPWKLIEWMDSGQVELFRLDVDPGEQYDLASTEPKRKAAMLEQLHRWQIQTGALMPTKNAPPGVGTGK